jgi:hypothetical protein
MATPSLVPMMRFVADIFYFNFHHEKRYLDLMVLVIVDRAGMGQSGVRWFGGF